VSGAPAARVRFRHGDERFELPAAEVERVLMDPGVVPLPGLGEHIGGVLLYDGRWIPVLVPELILGVRGEEPAAAALVIRSGGAVVALPVDEVVRVVREEPDPAADEEWARLTASDLIPVAEGTAAGGGAVGAGSAGGGPVGGAGGAAYERRSLVLFRVGDEDFTVAAERAREVLDYTPPQRVPGAPAFLLGVVEVRGEPLAVADLRTRIGVAAAPPDRDTRILVVEVGEERVGAVVDGVADVLRVPASAILPPPPLFRGFSADYLEGLVRTATGWIPLLRPERVLDPGERLELAAFRPAAGEG
jgi:purine-binding chemotaxis protein CheW